MLLHTAMEETRPDEGARNINHHGKIIQVDEIGDIKHHSNISKVDKAKTKENPDANGMSSKDDFNNDFSNMRKQEMNSLRNNHTHMILQFTGIR